MSTTKIKPPSKAYMNLIERFPLRQIHNENENRLALEMVRELMRRGDDKLSKDEIEYLVLLTDQIEKFEKTVYWSDRAKVPVLDCIKMLMREFGLTQAKLAEKLGVGQSNIAHILAGKQKLTVSQVDALSKTFHAPPSLFIER